MDEAKAEALKEFNRSTDMHASLSLEDGTTLCGLEARHNALRSTDHFKTTCPACLAKMREVVPAPAPTLLERAAMAATEVNLVLIEMIHAERAAKYAERITPKIRVHLWSRTVHDLSGNVHLIFDPRPDVAMSSESLSITVPGDHPLAKLQVDEDYDITFTPVDE